MRPPVGGSAKREPYEHNGEMRVEATLAGAVASLERPGYDVFDGLRQLADFGGLIVCVVAALPLSTVMALVQAPLNPELVFAEVDYCVCPHGRLPPGALR